MFLYWRKFVKRAKTRYLNISCYIVSVVESSIRDFQGVFNLTCNENEVIFTDIPQPTLTYIDLYYVVLFISTINIGTFNFLIFNQLNFIISGLFGFSSKAKQKWLLNDFQDTQHTLCYLYGNNSNPILNIYVHPVIVVAVDGKLNVSFE